MSVTVRNAVKYVFAFAAAAVICIVLLFLVCKIPQSAINENSRVSAEYLSQVEAFPLNFGRLLNSRGDNYAVYQT